MPCPECKGTNVVDYDGDVCQCLECDYIADADEFEEGCPECGSHEIVDYDGDLSQCVDCHYLAGSDEFEKI